MDMSNSSCRFGLTWAFMLLMETGTICAQQLDWTFVDETRGGREIAVDFRHPIPLESPVNLIVVGHGFAMQAADYDDLAADLVEHGWAVALVKTESNLSPSHADFGLDLAYVANHASSELDSGALAGLLGEHTAIVGHSMGGGAAWLASDAAEESIRTWVGLAPAETNPSAQEAAANIDMPVLVISGTADAVTPPEMHHIPLFEAATNSPCKALIHLNNAGHCGFADEGTLCDLGELFFNGMSRLDHQMHTRELLILWLEWHLESTADNALALQAYVDGQLDVEMTLQCSETSVKERSFPTQSLAIHPNPAHQEVQLKRWDGQPLGILQCFDSRGDLVPLPSLPVDSHQLVIQVRQWPAGIYTFHSIQESSIQTGRLVVY